MKIEGNKNNTGFFSHIGTSGRVVNLKLVNIDIVGKNNTGAIAGTSMGTIENSYVDGKVTGSNYTGGIVGLLHAGTLQNNSVTTTVSGITVGGLIGGTNWNDPDSPITEIETSKGKVILNNYVAGTVVGLRTYHGALISDMGGSRSSLLQTLHGNILVNSIDNVNPGKIGGYWSGARPIIDIDQINYFDIDKLSNIDLPGEIPNAFVGKTDSDFAQKATFEVLGWDFTNVWDWDTTTFLYFAYLSKLMKIT